MRTIRFSFPYMVADTQSGPVIQWENFNLRVEFQTFQNENCAVTFSEVSHFEFLSEDELDPTLFSYDGVVEVLESETLEKLISVGEIDQEESSNYKHIVIGFNGIGSYLSVIFKTMGAGSA